MDQIVEYINKNYLDIHESDPIVLGWIQNVFKWGNDATKIAWCSIFLMNVLSELGIDTNANASARSWLKHGSPLEEPEYGCLCILWRGSPTSWKGHVGIYIRETKDKVLLLGGNQSDKVKYCWYSKNRILGYRTAK